MPIFKPLGKKKPAPQASTNKYPEPAIPDTPGPSDFVNNNNGGVKYPAEDATPSAPTAVDDEDTLSHSSSTGSVKVPTPAPRRGNSKAKSNGSSSSQRKSYPPPPPSPAPTSPPPLVQRPKLVFHCQQAQGSPTGIISGFTSIKELYDKIALCYDFPASEILFCTLNTHKVDMNSLLGGQIGLEDFIFAHRRGQAKEIEITKSEDALGLTITDNGAGYCFIKKIREDSIIDRAKFIQVGDHIEKIDDINLVGKKHFEVAKMLKDIPKGTTFNMRLVEPLKSGFANLSVRGNPSTNKKGVGCGKKTIRLKASGQVTEQDAPDDFVQTAITKIDNLLESFMGINDNDLATQIWELGQLINNPIDFQEEIEGSDISVFGFTEDFILDLWGIIGDVKAGRI